LSRGTGSAAERPLHDETSGSMNNAHALAVLADSTTPNRYAGINPTLNAACVMGAFVVLLFLVTRLNRDK
jgi:hypothetical protein